MDATNILGDIYGNCTRETCPGDTEPQCDEPIDKCFENITQCVDDEWACVQIPKICGIGQICKKFTYST